MQKHSARTTAPLHAFANAALFDANTALPDLRADPLHKQPEEYADDATRQPDSQQTESPDPEPEW